MKTNPEDNALQESGFGGTNTLTKKEYFAIMAMQGMLADRGQNIQSLVLYDFARIAINMADALTEELNKSQKENT